MFTNYRGIMSSPYYPNYYPGKADCVYTISQPVGNVIVLKFLSMDIEWNMVYYHDDYSDDTDGLGWTWVEFGLDYEYQYGNLTCPYDYLEIRDGSSKQSPLIDKYCGDQTFISLPMEIQTTQNNVWMR